MKINTELWGIISVTIGLSCFIILVFSLVLSLAHFEVPDKYLIVMLVICFLSLTSAMLSVLAELIIIYREK